MATILEYHRSEDTIPQGQADHEAFVQAHLDKWLSPWPPDVREQLEQIIREHEAAIYGEIEFGIKADWDTNRLADELRAVKIEPTLEENRDRSAIRVTFDGDPERVKKVVEAH